MTESVDLNPQTLPPGRVRIVLPAKVAFNMDSLHQVIRNVGEAIGCRTCFSGKDCQFEAERDLLIDPESLEVR